MLPFQFAATLFSLTVLDSLLRERHFFERSRTRDYLDLNRKPAPQRANRT